MLLLAFILIVALINFDALIDGILGLFGFKTFPSGVTTILYLLLMMEGI